MQKNDEPSGGHMLGLGLQVAVGTGLGLWIGTWLDRRYEWTPWAAIIGAMLGMCGGLYLLVREAIRLNKD